MSTWFNPAASKREFRESIGSEHVFFHYFDGTPCRSYESLPDIAAHGREYGVRELCVWDRLALGIYGSAVSPGEDLLQYNYKEKEALANVIRQAREGGTDVSALVNFRLLNSSLDVVKNENLLEETQVALDGTRKLEQCNVAIIPGHSGLNVVFSHLGPYAHVFSPFSKKYRERILNQMQKYLDLGYQSLFYDQPFEYVPDYSCKDKGGIPEMTYAAVLESLRDVRKKLREKNPDAVIMGEQCDVFGAEVVDQWMSWGWSNLDIDSAVRLHYCLPQTVISCVVDREPGLASHAFAAGLHIMLMTKAGMGTLSDEPEFAEHIQKLAELRKKCADRTVHARFNHKRGLSVETEDSIVAYSYDGAMGPAVIIAAPEKAGKIRVHLDRGSFCRHETKKRGQLFHMDGSTSEVTDDSQELSLNKYEVLIWTA
ncbi:MAG: hypothetical protein HY646_16175 [Acidobacteria bacterium]|nr:hypothetical protein [Acidobacteriota bacterium]